MSAKGRRRTSGGGQIAVLAQSREPAREAYELRLTGLGWAEVAERVGYADGRVASMAVTAWLQKAAVQAGDDFRRDALDCELDRLDRLQAAYWSKALAGDLKAAAYVLRLIEARGRLLGFDRMTDQVQQRGRVLVIAGSPEQYAAQMKAYVMAREEGRELTQADLDNVGHA